MIQTDAIFDAKLLQHLNDAAESARIAGDDASVKRYENLKTLHLSQLNPEQLDIVTHVLAQIGSNMHAANPSVIPTGIGRCLADVQTEIRAQEVTAFAADGYEATKESSRFILDRQLPGVAENLKSKLDLSHELHNKYSATFNAHCAVCDTIALNGPIEMNP